jgi:hypothetical protein
MANNNFVVKNGLTVGATTIDATTGDLLVAGTITSDQAVTLNDALTVSGLATLAGPTVLSSTLQITGVTSAFGTLVANAGTNSTGISSGALQVVGGAGILNDVYVGGNFTQTGTGFNQLPVGTTSQRPINPTLGMVRFNSNLSIFEGYGFGNTWGGLGGVRSVDGRAYVVAETTPGAGDDVVRIYAGDSGTATQALWASSSNVSIPLSTPSTSATTGALQVVGGVGVQGNSNFGGNLTVDGTLTAPTFSNPFTSNNAVSTTGFVNNALQLSMSTVVLSGITGGRYSFDVQGFGCQFTFAAHLGAITYVLSVDNGGQGYYVGDIISPTTGNLDAMLVVQAESGGQITQLGILYPGSGYLNYNSQVPSFNPGMPASTFVLNGTITSNATFIVPGGTYLTGSNQWYIANNCANDNDNDSFDVKFYLTDGSGGYKGQGVTAIQGINNSRITIIQTDGVNDVYSVNGQTYIAYTDVVTNDSDILVANFDPPFFTLTDGLTVGVGANEINLTPTPTLNINGLGAFTIVKGTNQPLLVGDIGGNNHEMLMTFNLGTQTWVLQNPIFGVATTGIQYHDADDYQYFTTGNVVGRFVGETDGNVTYPEGELVFQGATLATATATGFVDSFDPTHNILVIESSTGINGLTNSLNIWNLHEIIYSANTGSKATLDSANTLATTDSLFIEFNNPYKVLLDGLTVGGGAQYVNQTPYPTLSVDGLAAATIVKGTNNPLVAGDIGGNNHEMLLTYNLGTQTWVLQNPTFGVATIGVQYIDAGGTSDALTMNFAVPYLTLLDGLTVGGGAQYINQTTTPTLNVDGLGAYTIVKGANYPLLLGDIGGNNHEMLLTFNLGTTTWVLQNPIFGVGSTGVQYNDADDYQYFYANVVSGTFISESVNNPAYPEGEIVYQGPNLAYATATGTIDSVSADPGSTGNIIVIENSVFTANGGSLFFGIWQVGQHIKGANSNAVANLYSFDSVTTSDRLIIDNTIPYQALLDGLTIGGGAQYVNQTTTPTLNVDGLGTYEIVKGTNQPLLPGDIGGNNHEMLLTYNLGTQTWVLQNPIYGIGGVGTMFAQDTGTVNNLVANFTPPFQKAIEGCLINVNPLYQNTGSAVTLTVDGLGTLNVKREGGYPLQPGDITGGGNYYALFTYNDGDWILTNPLNVFAPNLRANSGITSTSTTTGAIIIDGAGGIGVGGNVYASAVYDTSNRVVTTLTSTGASNLAITGTAPSLSINLPAIGSGAQNNIGGSGTIPVISTDPYGRVISLTSTALPTQFATLSTYGNTYLGAPTTITGVTTISNSTDSTGTAVGALVVNGGIGVGKSAYIGNNLYIGGNLYVSNVVSQGTSSITSSSSLVALSENYTYPYNFDIGIYSHITDGSGNIAQYTAFARNHANNYWSFVSNLQTNPGSGSGLTVNFTESDVIYDTVQAGGLILTNTTVATNTTSGALQVAGDAGIVGNVFAGTVYAGNYYFSNGTPFVDLTIANTPQIVANAAYGFNVGLSLVNTGVTAGTYGPGMPTITVGADGRITGLTTNTASTNLNVAGTIGSGSVSLLNGTLTVAGTNGITTSVSGSTLTVSNPQNLQNTASPTFGNLTVSNILQAAVLEIGTNLGAGTTTLAGTTILAGGIRAYAQGFGDGTDNYSDIRSNPSTGALAISSKAGPLQLQYDHGTGVAFGSGTGSVVGTIDQNGNANFLGAITQSGSQVLTAANYLSYSPNVTGTGATGTWPINISGTAGTAAASGLTGTTLATGVINSSLTSVGALTSLVVNGTTNLYGLVTATAGLTASYVYGGTIGNVGAIINGTVNQPAQTSITSLGTLTGLTVGGTATFNGSAIYNGTTTVNGTATYSSKVGIGTTSPIDLLTIDNQNAASTAGLSFYSAGTLDASTYSNSANWVFNSLRTNPIYWQINSSTVMTLNGSGYLGIGTTSPSDKLHVAGNFNVGNLPGQTGTFRVTTSSQGLPSPVSARQEFGTDNTGWQYRIAKNAGGTVTDLMTVADSGYVGIGTTSPSYNFQVQGNSYSTGFSRVNNAQYGFYAGNFINAGTYLHLKTNLVKNNVAMWTIEMVGYDYGAAWPIGAMWSGYNYAGTNSTINTGWKDYVDNGSAYANNVYDSADGHVVIVVYQPSQYFFQFVLNGYTVGEGYYDIAITATTATSSNSGAF